MSRKEKEKEFFAYHMDKFRKAQVTDPYFTIKTAFFQKGKYGRQVQLFDGELKRGEDIFIEFIDILRDDFGKEQGVEKFLKSAVDLARKEKKPSHGMPLKWINLLSVFSILLLAMKADKHI